MICIKISKFLKKKRREKGGDVAFRLWRRVATQYYVTRFHQSHFKMALPRPSLGWAATYHHHQKHHRDHSFLASTTTTTHFLVNLTKDKIRSC